MTTLLTKIEDILEQMKPGIIFEANLDDLTGFVSVINNEDGDYWLQPQDCPLADIVNLAEQFGTQPIYFLSTDDNREQVDYEFWCDAINKALNPPQPLTCSLADAIGFMVDAARLGDFDFCCGAAKWRVVS